MFSRKCGPLVKRSKTPPFHGGYTGSNPVRVTNPSESRKGECRKQKTEEGEMSVELGRLAQLGERLPYKQDVGSSILSSPTSS